MGKIGVNVTGYEIVTIQVFINSLQIKLSKSKKCSLNWSYGLRL
jgi:hypothetical protein